MLILWATEAFSREIFYNALDVCVCVRVCVCRVRARVCTRPHVRIYQVPAICNVVEEVQACPQFTGRHPPDTPSAAIATAAATAAAGLSFFSPSTFVTVFHELLVPRRSQ